MALEGQGRWGRLMKKVRRVRSGEIVENRNGVEGLVCLEKQKAMSPSKGKGHVQRGATRG